MTSSVRCTQFLGHSGVVHDPIFDITFNIGGSLASSLIAHLSYCEGSFLVDNFRVSQSTLGCDISCSVPILCHLSRRGFFKVVLSIESMILVKTLSPSSVFTSLLRMWGRLLIVYSSHLYVLRPCVDKFFFLI